jgi:hypothetical protein
MDPVSPAVRHATRAPAERPPVMTFSKGSCCTTAIQAASSVLAAGCERRPATR